MAMATPNPRAPTPASLPIYNKPQTQSANARVLASNCTGVGAEAQNVAAALEFERKPSPAKKRARDAAHDGLRLSAADHLPRPGRAARRAGLCRRPSRMGKHTPASVELGAWRHLSLPTVSIGEGARAPAAWSAERLGDPQPASTPVGARSGPWVAADASSRAQPHQRLPHPDRGTSTDVCRHDKTLRGEHDDGRSMLEPTHFLTLAEHNSALNGW